MLKMECYVWQKLHIFYKETCVSKCHSCCWKSDGNVRLATVRRVGAKLAPTPKGMRWWWRQWVGGAFILHTAVFLVPLHLGQVLLTPQPPLLLFVANLNHFSQFPRQQRTGDEERRERQQYAGQEAIGVLGGPLHNVLGPCSHHLNHGAGKRIVH